MATSVTNSSDPTPDPRPTGDLEYLFRQRLGEAEVPPRLQLWEQLDHDLLVQQNEAYRRRLVVYRWLAAACVLLVLGLGSWAGLQQLGPTPTTEIAAHAAKQRQATARKSAGVSGATRAVASGSTQGNGAGAVPPVGIGEELAAGNGPLSADKIAALLTDDSPLRELAARPAAPDAGVAGSTAAYLPALSSSPTPGFESGNDAFVALLAARAALLRPAGLRVSRPDTLKPSLRTAPPMLAALGPLPEEEHHAARTGGRWHFGGSHNVSSFNPNINFSQASTSASTIAYAMTNNAFIPTADAQTLAYETGAAEYRQNLRAGVGQRATLTASYAASPHWVLTTGLEAADYRAASETSFSSVAQAETAFSGRALPAYQNTANTNFATSARAVSYTSPRATSYRYRTVGVPVSARYGSNKNGVSFYAKVGAAVDLLLGSRVEVENVAAATREYSLASADSPYRKVLATVRGGGGVQYRPAGAAWSLLVGPTAEAGLTTLNSHPVQPLLRQARPYAVGLEASVEFGGGPAAPASR